LVNQMHKADFDGTVSGITQTAQQTYLKQFAPQDTEEAEQVSAEEPAAETEQAE